MSYFEELVSKTKNGNEVLKELRNPTIQEDISYLLEIVFLARVGEIEAQSAKVMCNNSIKNEDLTDRLLNASNEVAIEKIGLTLFTGDIALALESMKPEKGDIEGKILFTVLTSLLNVIRRYNGSSFLAASLAGLSKVAIQYMLSYGMGLPQEQKAYYEDIFSDFSVFAEKIEEGTATKNEFQVILTVLLP